MLSACCRQRQQHRMPPRSFKSSHRNEQHAGLAECMAAICRVERSCAEKHGRRKRTAGTMRRMQAQTKDTTRPYGTKQRSSACCASALDWLPGGV